MLLTQDLVGFSPEADHSQTGLVEGLGSGWGPGGFGAKTCCKAPKRGILLVAFSQEVDNVPHCFSELGC